MNSEIEPLINISERRANGAKSKVEVFQERGLSAAARNQAFSANSTKSCEDPSDGRPYTDSHTAGHANRCHSEDQRYSVNDGSQEPGNNPSCSTPLANIHRPPPPEQQRQLQQHSVSKLPRQSYSVSRLHPPAIASPKYLPSISMTPPQHSEIMIAHTHSDPLIHLSPSSTGPPSPVLDYVQEKEPNEIGTNIIDANDEASGMGRGKLIDRIFQASSSPEIEQSDEHDLEEYPAVFTSETYFNEVIDQINEALALGIHPERIAQGSSGSYFVRNKDRKIVAVFKPKDEEPYGNLNPKWNKFLHKNLCPCTFGRGCLIPNQGYLSEVGASIVDTLLNLKIVPKTHIVRFSSPSFHYHWYERWFSDQLPEKKGSLQLFVHGYKDAYTVVKDIFNDIDRYKKTDINTRDPHTSGIQPQQEQEKAKEKENVSRVKCRSDISSHGATDDAFHGTNQHRPPANCSQRQMAANIHPSLTFQFEFEKLVCLDYLTRNTDRGNDNWLLKYQPETNERVSIAAIDNGLSFPFKHPDHWRTYPYYWAWLPCSKIRFSDEIYQLLHPKLSNPDFVEHLLKQLQNTFKTDGAFGEALFLEQASVVRGQVLNLTRALEDKKTPFELLQIPVMSIVKNTDFEKQQFPSPACFTWC